MNSVITLNGELGTVSLLALTCMLSQFSNLQLTYVIIEDK